jgi:hypothetical protein
MPAGRRLRKGTGLKTRHYKAGTGTTFPLLPGICDAVPLQTTGLKTRHYKGGEADGHDMSCPYKTANVGKKRDSSLRSE